MVVNSKLRSNTGKLLKVSYKKDKKLKSSLDKDYNYDQELSNSNTKVWVDKETGKPVIVHRGTKTIGDLGTDILVGLGLGKYSSRVKQVKKTTKKVEEKYKQAADTVGHSLGGYLAENSGSHGDVITYNKANMLIPKPKRTKENQLDIYTEGDIVGLPSRLLETGDKEIISNVKGGYTTFDKALNAHNTDNLL
jgi:hypothetical protein